MDFLDDPFEMTPEQRLREVAAILALAFTEKRLDVTAAPTPPCAEGLTAPREEAA